MISKRETPPGLITRIVNAEYGGSGGYAFVAAFSANEMSCANARNAAFLEALDSVSFTDLVHRIYYPVVLP